MPGKPAGDPDHPLRGRNPNEITRTKAAQGIYDFIEPLDFRLLEKIPDEGKLVAGLYPLSETSGSLAKMFPPITATVVSMRTRQLELMGMLVRVRVLGGGTAKFGYQITTLGKEKLAEWQNRQQLNGQQQ